MMNTATRRISSQNLRRLSTRLLLSVAAAVSTLALASASAQSTGPITPLEKQFARIDLAVGVMGSFTPGNSGRTYLPQIVAQRPSNTAGALIELRYTRSALVGFQLNYTQVRYADNYTLSNTTGTPAAQLPYAFNVQSKVTEFSLGYVAHGPQFFGITPFAGGGGGSMEFKPTAGGGNSVSPEVRFAAYYTIGAQAPLLGEHFGMRVQFRQTFFGAPDFNENYLANGQRSVTTEPAVGFYLRF